MQTVTSRSFNQNTTAIKRAANNEPVGITEQSKNLVDLLAMPESSDALEFAKLDASSIKPVDF